MRALFSVSDKTGVVEFARELQSLGWDIIATGGTMKLLQEAGLKIINISEVTGFPEICDGRVKTLHPKVHGGLLGRRDLQSHIDQLKENGIEFIDMVCVNLYPFKQTIAKPDVTMEDAIENIDIGGPSMLRSAAKNWSAVTVVCNPDNYGLIIDDIVKFKKDNKVVIDQLTHRAKGGWQPKTVIVGPEAYGMLQKSDEFVKHNADFTVNEAYVGKVAGLDVVYSPDLESANWIVMSPDGFLAPKGVSATEVFDKVEGRPGAILAQAEMVYGFEVLDPKQILVHITDTK